MAINLIVQPGATTPITNADYTQQNLLINGALAQGHQVLTAWADTLSQPDIKQGTYFYHSGNLYQVDSADEAISGTIVSGVNYIALVVSGSTLTASYITDISGYAWNPAYNGLYNGTSLVIRAVVVLDGTDYYRGLAPDIPSEGNVILSSGEFYNVSIRNNFLPSTTPVYTIFTIPANGNLLLPRGMYYFPFSSSVFAVEAQIQPGLWIAGSYQGYIGLVVSDGVNTRITNSSTSDLGKGGLKF